MVHGRFFKRGLNYWVGGFRHDGDNARSKRIEGGDETFAARVTGLPFRKLSPKTLGGLELGTAVAFTKLSDDSFRPNGLRGRTTLTQDTFYNPVYVKGDRQRFEADVDWTIGPASARAEHTRQRQPDRPGTRKSNASRRTGAILVCGWQPGWSRASENADPSRRPIRCRAAVSAPWKWLRATSGSGSTVSARRMTI